MGKDKKKATCHIVLGVLGAAVAFAIGVIIGHYARSKPKPCMENVSDGSEDIVSDFDSDLTKRMRAEINADQLKENLRSYTRIPHVGGLRGSKQIADEIDAKWREYGLDLVEQSTYDVLLSYPDENNPNFIKLFNGATEVYKSAENEVIPGEDNTGVIQPFNAYSPSGIFTGDMVYVNYCQREDFEDLVKMGVSVSGHIVICRYGNIFRGSKVAIATSYNATGVILFSDPKDYAAEGVDKVYPDTWWLPPTGVQRGSVYSATGDPLTPGYPAIKSAYRLKEEDAQGIPSIPSHPIGYKDAEQFLRALGGQDVPATWQGGLNFTYKIGPLKTNMRVEIVVNNKYTRANATNVIGYLKGSVEPDRYVLIGGHRDAWAYGALDPNTGTAVAVELVRVLGQFKKNGWRPRRTIVFCSWGAEEFGLIGSFEWVEQNVRKINERAVAYLNLDTVVNGNNSLLLAALPIMNEITFEAAKSIDTPNQNGKSMYQEWAEAFPDPEDASKPLVLLPGASSDHAAFFIVAGVPIIDFSYTYDRKKYPVSGYPVYHSGIETFKIFETFIDPDCKYMQGLARFVLEILIGLSHKRFIPYDIENYGDAIVSAQNKFEKNYKTLLAGKNINLAYFKAAAQAFKRECDVFLKRLDNIKGQSPTSMEVRAYNDAMMYLERAFLDPQGLPGRPLYRHVIFAPSLANSYAGSAFPGLTDALYQIEDDPDQDGRWETFKRHLATVTYILENAAESLKEFYDI